MIKVNAEKNPEIYFNERLFNSVKAEKEAQEKFNSLAIMRLLAFVSFAGLGWYAVDSGKDFFGIVSGAIFIAFLILMKLQQKARRKRDYEKNIQLINVDETERLSFKFVREDNGKVYKKKDHPYASDLDIFGEYSLFKLLNRSRTAAGSKRLSRWLKNPAPLEEILMRQETSEEFLKNADWRQNWEATALLNKQADQQIGSFQKWIEEELPQDLKSSLIWRYWPIATLIIGILFGFGLLSGWILALSLGWHLLILKRYQEEIKELTNSTTALGQTILAYSELLDIAEASPFQSRWWKIRTAHLQNSGKSLKKVGTLFDALDYRNNPYFAIFVGIPTLWDMHCLASLEKWRVANKTNLANWLNVLADTEAMNSISGFRYANPDFAVPQVSWKNGISMHAENMGHPLIHASKRINNSFEMDGTGHTILITGSNMSGKSTFLRTIGLNFVLAQTGAVVCATRLSCSPARVFSSMRTNDSLEESTSSFYAELKRLKQLLELADESNNTPIFYLLDEILKGTNSADRHKGAEALIKQLHKKNASGLVSTHDLELGNWGATQDYIANYHFRSDMENGELKFDYKLHNGICESFNASELMRMMGIDIDQEK